MLVLMDSMRMDPDPERARFLVSAWRAAHAKAQQLGWLAPNRRACASRRNSRIPCRGPARSCLPFRLRPDGIAEELGVDRAIAVEPRGWLWLHFNLADAWACHFLRLSPYFPAGARIARHRRRPPTAQCE